MAKKLLDQTCTELAERVHTAIRIKHRAASLIKALTARKYWASL